MPSFANLSSKLDSGQAFIEWHRSGTVGQTLLAQTFNIATASGRLIPNDTEDIFLGEETPVVKAVPKGGFPDWIVVDQASSKITLQPGSYRVCGEFHGFVQGTPASGVPVNWSINDGSTSFLEFQPQGGTIQLYLVGQNVHQAREGCFDLAVATDIFVYCVEVGTGASETVRCEYFRTSFEKL